MLRWSFSRNRSDRNTALFKTDLIVKAAKQAAHMNPLKRGTLFVASHEDFLIVNFSVLEDLQNLSSQAHPKRRISNRVANNPANENLNKGKAP